MRKELVSKRFSLSKVKDGASFNHRNTARISRIKIGNRRRDWAKWGVLKLAPKTANRILTEQAERLSREINAVARCGGGNHRR
jgi:hypothetical protein